MNFLSKIFFSSFLIFIILFLIFIKYSEKLDHFGSFMSVIIGFVTIFLVYLTYQTQKEELQAAKEEAKASREALQHQAKTSQLQQFENTFFNLLANHREVLGSLSEKWYSDQNTKDTSLDGKILISQCASFFKELLNGIDGANGLKPIPFYILCKNVKLKRIDNNLFIPELATPEGIPKLYELIFEANLSSLAHYLRNLYHLVLFVDEYEGFNVLFDNKRIEEIKYKYVRLVRAQLSNDELILLALNSISSYGEKFKPLVVKYNLLDNVNILAEFNNMAGLLEMYPHFAPQQKG